MATIADSMGADPVRRVARRDRFFLFLSLAMCAVIVAGFTMNLVMGRSSFAVPAIYHIHAFVFFGWVAIFLTQNLLIASNNVRLHRKLGWIALLWVPLMVAMGVAITLHSLRTHGGPPFFALPEFLFGNPVALLCFAGLALAAVTFRGRSDWHRRLMICAMAGLTGPGFGRLLPLPLLIPWSWVIAALIFPLIFPLIGIAGDLARTRRVHPAWLWGVAAMIGTFAAAEALANSAWGISFARSVVAGTPGADRDFAPHFP